MYRAAIGLAAAACLALGGVVEAATVRTAKLAAGTNHTWTATFRGGAEARVVIVGDGDSNLDVFVYAANGDLIARGDGPSDREVVAFTPRSTGKFRLVVVNRSRTAANRCSIAWTN